MNLEQLKKANELQKHIEKCKVDLERYKKLEKSKMLCIYSAYVDVNDSSIYVEGDMKYEIIKTIKDYEQLKIDGYLLEFKNL